MKLRLIPEIDRRRQRYSAHVCSLIDIIVPQKHSHLPHCYECLMRPAVSNKTSIATQQFLRVCSSCSRYTRCSNYLETMITFLMFVLKYAYNVSNISNTVLQYILYKTGVLLFAKINAHITKRVKHFPYRSQLALLKVICIKR